MISGAHAIIYSKQADRLREFFRDTLKLPSVDAGRGWLIFALPPAEIAVHPGEDSYHELYLMCDDVHATTDELKGKGIELSVPIADRGWGLVTRLRLPSGDEIGLYQPKHPTAIALSSSTKSPSQAGRSTRKAATNPRSAAKLVKSKKLRRKA